MLPMGQRTAVRPAVFVQLSGWSMMSQSLHGCRVLLVEDDYLIADDFVRRLHSAGAHVIGPAATLDGALALYESAGMVDFVILDINLRGTTVFPFATRLREDGVPFLFCTGYGDEVIDASFRNVERFEKPISQHGFARMVDLISRLNDARDQQRQHFPM
jgi:two-component SAPR family response regulator